MLPPLPVVLAWPLVALLFFRRFSLPGAIALTIVLGYLLLPTAGRFNLPMLPTINKESMPSLAALVLAILFVGKFDGRANHGQMRPAVQPGWLPKDTWLRWLVIAAVGATALTVFTNGDRMVFTNLAINGLRPYDFLANAQTLLIELLPFILARKYLATPESQKSLLLILGVTGFFYSFLALYEIRMSPQLNYMVYGFRPSGWIQNLRDDGFRPFVFVSHGLKLGIFLCCAVIASLALASRVETRWKSRFWFIFAWLFMTLLLTKAFGAFLIAVVLIPVVLLLNTRLQLIVAASIAAAVLLYPMLRGANLVPVNHIVSFARSIDDDRGSSLQYRINNETILLEKANQRPLFGWGGWGRSRVYNENGRDLSTTDGLWIITIGEGGWVGYLARFGLLCGPIIFLAWRRRSEVGPETAALSIVLAGNLVDLLVNTGLTGVTWLVAGSLLGRLEYRAADPGGEKAVIDPETPQGPRYTRVPKKSGQRSRPPAPPRNRPDRARPLTTPRSARTKH